MYTVLYVNYISVKLEENKTTALQKKKKRLSVWRVTRTKGRCGQDTERTGTHSSQSPTLLGKGGHLSFKNLYSPHPIPYASVLEVSKGSC